MYNSFLSIVLVIETTEDIQRLHPALANLHGQLENTFADYEIILVNNTYGRSFDEEINRLPPSFRHNIFLLNLSSPVVKNHAIVAGLDRTNGDYTIIFELDFYEQAHVIIELYEQCTRGSDIVYLRARYRQTKIRFRLLYKLFYWILKKYSNLRIDDHAHDTRIISRRALNSLLRLRENLRYMKAIYSIIGYRTSALDVDVPLRTDPSSFSEKFRTSLVAITSFTTFLRTMLLWIFLSSIIFMTVIIINAIKVKVTNIDLLGTYHPVVSGWTFLVVLTSIFFAITCLMLYIMSIYLSNIYQEIKHRPMYIIESVKRF